MEIWNPSYTWSKTLRGRGRFERWSNSSVMSRTPMKCHNSMEIVLGVDRPRFLTWPLRKTWRWREKTLGRLQSSSPRKEMMERWRSLPVTSSGDLRRGWWWIWWGEGFLLHGWWEKRWGEEVVRERYEWGRERREKEGVFDGGVFFLFFVCYNSLPPPRNLVPEIQVRAEEEDKEMITEMMMKQQNDRNQIRRSHKQQNRLEKFILES